MAKTIVMQRPQSPAQRAAFEQHLYLVPIGVRRVEARLRIAGFDRDDMYQEGAIGLMDAVRLWRPDGGASFRTYAYRRIVGQIIDAARVARPFSRTEMENARAGRTYKGIDDAAARVRALWEASRPFSLDEVLLRRRNGEDTLDLGDKIADPEAEAAFDRVIDREEANEVAALVLSLPEVERVVVTLYYWEELTVARIGGFLGVSESRASQILIRARQRLVALWVGARAA